jgi:hypothetical protein
MIELTPNVNQPTATYRLRISYHDTIDAVTIEHFSKEGALLSECRLTPEDAMDYARTITDVCDEALGIV